MQSGYPFDAGPGSNITEDQWAKMAANWLDTGVLAGLLLELAVFADSTGMQVKLRSGQAWIKGFFYENDAELALAIGGNASGNPRIDRVVIRLDRVANTVAAAVVAGVPGAVPVAPALTQTAATWELPLAQVLVNAGDATIPAGRVTDQRIYTQNVPRAHTADPTLDNHSQYLLTTGTRTTGGVVLAASAIGVSPLILRGMVGQTAPPLLVQNSALASLLSLSAAGLLAVIGNIQGVGADHHFGIGAAGAAGTFIKLSSGGDAANAYVFAEGSAANVGLLLRSKGSGDIKLQTVAGVNLATLSATDPAANNANLVLRMNIGGVMVDRRVLVEVAGSGGVGQRALTVLN